MPDEKSCGAVVFRDAPATGGQKRKTHEPARIYLLLHYEEGHWDFPKGRVEAGEDELATATRETREETGIADLVFIGGFRERIGYSYRREGKTLHKEVFFFIARTHSADVRLSSEHVGFVWLPYEDALARLTYDNAKDVLRKAEGFLSGPTPLR
jgi:8-oxo-dGTP pyrophosphatase MutT (NUDIX family)